MPTAVPEEKVSNPYITSLTHLISDKQATFDWLVIAHNDPVMIRRVSGVVSNESAIIRIPQCDWDLDTGAVHEAVEWSLSAVGIQHLLLVGHSQAGVNEGCASWGSDETAIGEVASGDSSSRFHRPGLLDRAARSQRVVQQSKDHFVCQIDRLCKNAAVQAAIVEGRLQLHGLFFLAHSGTFLVFDFVRQTLRPISG